MRNEREWENLSPIEIHRIYCLLKDGGQPRDVAELFNVDVFDVYKLYAALGLQKVRDRAKERIMNPGGES